jgi:hypothetical protein
VRSSHGKRVKCVWRRCRRARRTSWQTASLCRSSMSSATRCRSCTTSPPTSTTCNTIPNVTRNPDLPG